MRGKLFLSTERLNASQICTGKGKGSELLLTAHLFCQGHDHPGVPRPLTSSHFALWPLYFKAGAGQDHDQGPL